MQKSTKIGLGILAIILIVGVALGSNSELFQGKFGARPIPVPKELIRPRCEACPSIPEPQYVNRAELMRLMVEAFDTPLVTDTEQHFSDVPPSVWYFPYVETAYAREWIGPYGGTFSPESIYTRAEFAAILSRALDIRATTPATMTDNHIPIFTDVTEEVWYSGYVRHLYYVGVFRVDFRPADLIEREFVDEALANATSE